MSKPDTKHRILDAAERLFADKGYHNTSLRNITSAAKANLASVNYHFGSKEALISEVMDRRLAPINKIRTEKLKAIQQTARDAGSPPLAEEAFCAFIEPMFTFRESAPNARHFIALVGRSLAEPDGTVRNIFKKQIMPVFQLLFEVISEALPHIPEKVLYWRLHFAIGSVSHTMHCLCSKPMIHTECAPPQDSTEVLRLLLPFITAGMEAPL